MILETIKTFIDADPNIRTAYLFGSVAKGTHTSTSDIDIAIECEKKLTSAEKIHYIESLALVTSRPIDLIDLQTVGEPLLGQILTHGIRLKGTNTTHGSLLYKHMLATSDFYPYVQRLLKERRNKWTGLL